MLRLLESGLAPFDLLQKTAGQKPECRAGKPLAELLLNGRTI
jgi:hypothetical protein